MRIIAASIEFRTFLSESARLQFLNRLFISGEYRASGRLARVVGDARDHTADRRRANVPVDRESTEPDAAQGAAEGAQQPGYRLVQRKRIVDRRLAAGDRRGCARRAARGEHRRRPAGAELIQLVHHRRREKLHAEIEKQRGDPHHHCESAEGGRRPRRER